MNTKESIETLFEENKSKYGDKVRLVQMESGKYQVQEKYELHSPSSDWTGSRPCMPTSTVDKLSEELRAKHWYNLTCGRLFKKDKVARVL